jgi:hypothetical protein
MAVLEAEQVEETEQELMLVAAAHNPQMEVQTIQTMDIILDMVADIFTVEPEALLVVIWNADLPVADLDI